MLKKLPAKILLTSLLLALTTISINTQQQAKAVDSATVSDVLMSAAIAIGPQYQNQYQYQYDKPSPYFFEKRHKFMNREMFKERRMDQRIARDTKFQKDIRVNERNLIQGYKPFDNHNNNQPMNRMMNDKPNFHE